MQQALSIGTPAERSPGKLHVTPIEMQALAIASYGAQCQSASVSYGW